MYLAELVNYNDIIEDGVITDSKRYESWLEQVEDGVIVILADIGVDTEVDYDEWLDEKWDTILTRLSSNDIININPSEEEQQDLEEIIAEVFDEWED